MAAPICMRGRLAELVVRPALRLAHSIYAGRQISTFVVGSRGLQTKLVSLDEHLTLRSVEDVLAHRPARSLEASDVSIRVEVVSLYRPIRVDDVGSLSDVVIREGRLVPEGIGVLINRVVRVVREKHP